MRWRMLIRALVAGAAALAVTPAAGAQTPTRYSLAGGCYALSGVSGAEHVRMQATALGRYLLYTPERKFIAAQDDGSVAAADAPSPAADWQVTEAGGGAFPPKPSPGGPEPPDVPFPPADGCAVYPEAGLDATGTPGKGAPPYGHVGGLVEGHMHWMSFQYFGGRFH